MKVSKNNFWLRLNQEFYGSTPRTLCGFFWKSIFAFLMVFTSPLVLVGNLIQKCRDKTTKWESFGKLPYADKIVQFFTLLFTIPDGVTLNHLFVSYIALSVSIILIIILIGLIIVLFDFIGEHRDKKRQERYGVTGRPVKMKEPNILIESFKAIKGKVCPIIEVVD